jgi:hypothetical protein
MTTTRSLALPDQLKRIFTDWDGLKRYITITEFTDEPELQRMAAGVSAKLIRKIPEKSATETKLILPESAETKDTTYTHMWVIVAGGNSDAFKFALVPMYSIVDLPGREGWGVVRTEDVLVTTSLRREDIWL